MCPTSLTHFLHWRFAWYAYWVRLIHPFQPLSHYRRSVVTLALVFTVLLGGCNRSAIIPESNPHAAYAQQQAQERAQTELIRQQIDLIPPPSKSRYLAIRSLSTWENPYLTVQGSMLTLHVTVADANTTDLGLAVFCDPLAHAARISTSAPAIFPQRSMQFLRPRGPTAALSLLKRLTTLRRQPGPRSAATWRPPCNC